MDTLQHRSKKISPVQSSSYKNRLLERLKEKRGLYVYLPLGIYWGILLVGTSLPASKAPDFTVNDKFQHFGAYAVLGFLLTLALFLQEKYTILNRNLIFASVSIITVYAALDEIHQIFIPGRSADPLDLLADFIGAIAGSIIFVFIRKKFLT